MSSLQKKLAAKILKVGQSRIWLDPSKQKDIEKAITRIDIKKLIKQGFIKKIPEKISMPKERRRKKKTVGSRKGAKYAVVSRKRKWISTIRPLRRMLKELKLSDQIDSQTYKRIYLLIKGGMFRSKAHLKLYLEQHDLIKKK